MRSQAIPAKIIDEHKHKNKNARICPNFPPSFDRICPILPEFCTNSDIGKKKFGGGGTVPPAPPPPPVSYAYGRTVLDLNDSQLKMKEM